MKTLASFAFALIWGIQLPAALPPAHESLKADAEKLYAEKSFAKAHELYARALVMSNLTSNEARWVFFRNADTLWRAQAATPTADTTQLDQAREWLEQWLRETQPGEDRDQTWAEAQESLGDFHWTRRGQQNWGQAWPYYEPALDWWAGARDLELARERYLGLVWKAARPPGVSRDYQYGYWGNSLPLQVLENAIRIAKTENDQAHAHFLMTIGPRLHDSEWRHLSRVPEEFEAALKPGKTTDWYDDALFNYAQWMATRGRASLDANGNWREQPDYAKALELFRRLVQEFAKGETRYWEQAQQQIKQITEPQLGVSVGNIFLPDSEIQYHLNWRNVKQIELALYPVELNRDVKLGEQRENWLESINVTTLEKLKSWEYAPGSAGVSPASSSAPRQRDASAPRPRDQNDYRPGNESPRLDAKLKPGAYVLEAKGGSKRARELILVTDATLVLKTSGQQALVYFCNALDGSPLATGKVRLWERWHDGNKWHTREQSKDTGTDGIAVFDLATRQNNGLELFASAITKDRQAFSPGNSYWHRTESESWKIYAFTDRPAYRPKETVNWKFIARRFNGSIYSTPSETTVEWEITDPRGAKVKADRVKLNSFGSAWGTLELTEAMPLGEYRVQFWDEGRKIGIGDATLFRLEEYKLPEFKVSVTTPEERRTGVAPVSNFLQKKTFLVGEKVEVEIQADYYFGGPVANATVEVLVHQNPYWPVWHRPREFPWFYENMDGGESRWGRHFGGGQILKRESLKTDATGKATLTFDTPANAGQDFEYRIEARVTDASRREISGSGTVRVTRQRYYVYPQAEHNLYRPQDKARVDFRAQDANEQPVQTEATVKITRDYWFEIWLAPDGREVKGEELKALQAKSKIWPPPPERPDQKSWRLKFRGYEHDDILTQSLKTDTNGLAQISFTPERDGYYRIAWTSEEDVAQVSQPAVSPISKSAARENSKDSGFGNPRHSRLGSPRYVRAETTIWVATGKSTDLAYRHGGVEIIADQDTFRAGSETPVMLVANSPDRYVLFTVEGEELYHHRLVHLDGTVKLLDLFVDEKFVPNVFLSAAMVSDRQIFTDTKQIIVPPTRHFLTVDVKPDRPQYQPQNEGQFTVTTRDHEGKPVSAEVAFSLVDESVFYIQSDYAGDPRQFYFGEKRSHQIQTQSTMNQKSYAKLVKGEKDELIEQAEIDRRKAKLGLGQESDEDGVTNEVLAESMVSGGGGGGALAKSESAGRMVRQRYGLAGAPAPASPAMAFDSASVVAGAKLGRSAEPMAAPEPASEPVVQVRTDFRSTILWQPELITDQNGQATVKLKYPDSLTGWKATARAATAGQQFGIAHATTRTKQPLIVRLQAPRFFVVGDTVTLSAVVNNNTDEAIAVNVALEVAGGLAVGQASRLSPSEREAKKSETGATPVLRVNVPANGEARADWTAEVKSPGEVKLKVTGRGSKYADAMEKTYVAFEHGIEKFISKSGKARGEAITVKLDLPKERKADSTSLTVQVTPSLAVTMLDALPYLIDYPYGCTEQTMSRFLPAAITAKTLRDLGLQPEDVMGRVFGGIETNTAAATHPKGKKDLADLDKITKAGLERLYDFQQADGGWAWWKEGDSDRWMTAYVVWGLALAKDAGIKLKTGVLYNGAAFLDKALVEEEENPDRQAFMLHALAVYNVRNAPPSEFQAKAFANLWTNREKLNAYTRALFALAAHHLGKAEQARTLVANLENGVKRDERPDESVLIEGNIQHSTSNIQHSMMGTAHWGEGGFYWRWSDGGVEATAFALRALLAIDPTHKLVEPVANWLIKNRRGAQWSNTRDTAIVVLAMNDYLRASGELKADLEYELVMNGHSIATNKVSGADVFNKPSRFAIDPKLLSDRNEVRLVRHHGVSPIYFAIEAKFFSLEEPVTPAGNEIFAKREYAKLVGRPTLLKGYVYDKEPLRDGESVKSGERVETLITIEAKNNYEYLVFEDLKPAGFEAVEIRSGESLYARELKSGTVARTVGQASRLPQTSRTASKKKMETGATPVLRPEPTDFTGRTAWVYQELRDRKVALFIDKLPEGVWEIRYPARAEVPGTFHALPVVGHAMYVPEIRCNGAELRVQVEDAK